MKITYYLTNYPSVNNIPYQLGNLIFSQNEKKIYLDGTSGRTSYDAVTILQTEAQRQALSVSYSGFFYVEATQKIWRFSNGSWKCLNPDPEVAESDVIFMSYDDFPAFGQEHKLYVDSEEGSIYVWTDKEEDYKLIGSSDEEWIPV